MRFLEFLKEATAKGKTPAEKKKEAQEADNHVAITFGRFNPPHAGHGKLLDAVKAHGGDSLVTIGSILLGHRIIRRIL